MGRVRSGFPHGEHGIPCERKCIYFQGFGKCGSVYVLEDKNRETIVGYVGCNSDKEGLKTCQHIEKNDCLILDFS